MCYQIIPLATHDEQHFISRCEHGTLHLNWERLVVRFHPDEITKIAHALKHYTPDTRDTVATTYVTLVWDDQDMVQLWLMRAGFYLCPHAFAVLLSLITRASQIVQSGSSTLLDQQSLMRASGYRPGASPN